MCGAERWPTSSSSSLMLSSVSSSVAVLDADCACGCQLLQPVGQIIIAANHSCFATATRPITWQITADPGRVIQLTYRLLAGHRRHQTDDDPARFNTSQFILLSHRLVLTSVLYE